MNKFWSIIQYGYLIVGVVFIGEGVSKWNSDRQGALIMFGFAIFIILIFFFKRKFRKKIEARNSNKD